MIRNKKYEPNKKNGGIAPAVSDIRTTYVPIGCGDCIECRKKTAREWSVRLQEEIKTNKNGKFVTLTFNTESIIKLRKEAKEIREQEIWNAIIDEKEKVPKKLIGYDLDNAAATLGIRRFLERWRKKYKKSVRHWLITELGGNNWEHIHIHGIIFTNEKIQPIWQYGGVSIGKYLEEWTEYRHESWVGNDTINYIVKYLYKKDEKHQAFKSKILCSSGIGNNYINTYNASRNKFKGKETIEKYIAEDGSELPLPIYYRNKIYSEQEKEKLWIQKLNEKVRYVCGQKIKVETEEDLIKYAKTVEYVQQTTKQLGYGDGKAWKRKEYENALREIMQTTRAESLINKNITHIEAHKRQKSAREKLIEEWNNKHG